jgi:hypothetical protein
MRDKRRDLSRDFSAPLGSPRPGLPPTRGHLQPSGHNADRNLEAGHDGYQGRGFYIDEFRVPTSLEGGVMVDGAARSWRSRGVGVVRVLTTIAVAAIAAAVTVMVAPRFLSPPPQKPPSDRPEVATQVERPGPVAEEPANTPPPRLASVDAVTQDGDEPLSLNVSLLGTAGGGWMMIRGLAPGSVVSGGRPLAEGNWRVDVSHLQDARVRPPRGFTGSMDVSLELRLGDDTLVDRHSMRLEWLGVNKMTALTPADTRSAAAEPQTSEPRVPLRPEQRQAFASLVARGKELLRNGDFSSARLILQRAADAGDADAALTLGSSYDPIILTRLGLRSQVANVDLARTWYEKAQEFGSTEAATRLKTLGNR